MNHGRFLFITFFFGLFNQLHAELPFIYLKDLYNKVSKDYKYLSPINGFHWWKLGIIENLYRFGDPNDETVKLIRELFYLQPWDNITFDITTLDNKPAKYLTSRTIGKILALFESQAPTEFTEKTEKEFKESLKQVIKDDLQFSTLIAQAQKKKEQHEMQLVQLPQRMNEIDKELKKLSKSKQQTEKFLRYKQKNLEEMIRTGASKEKIVQVTASIKSDQNILESINEKINQFTGYRQKFAELGRLRKKITQEIAKENLTEKSIDRFVDHLVGCYKESLDSPNQRYPKFTFHQIMLGFLWKKVQKKPDFADYFVSFLNYNISIVGNSDLMAGKIPEWLTESSIYTSADFDKYKNSFPNEDLVFLLKNYELASFLMYAYIVLGDFIIPPIVDSSGNTHYKQYQFPDCVETSIRNMINIAIFDANRDVLDIDSLPKTSAQEQFSLQISTPMIEFYRKNYRIENVESDILHDEWANVVSELSGVDYREDNVCNIISGAHNTFKVINHLLFGNNTAFNALSNSKKVILLCERLSSDTMSISWHENDEIDDKDTFNLDFTITKNGTSEDFTWEIMNQHSIITGAEIRETEAKSLARKLLTAFIDLPTFQINNLLGWILRPDIINKITKEAIVQPQLVVPIKILCCALKLKNSEIKDQLLSILLPFANTTPEFDGFTNRLIRSIPQDFYAQQILLQHILNAPERYYQLIPNILEKESNERNKTNLIQTIISHIGMPKNKFLNDLVMKATKHIRDETNLNRIFATIVYSDAHNLANFLMENFDQIFIKNDQETLLYALRMIFERDTIDEELKKLINKKLIELTQQRAINLFQLKQIIQLLIKHHKKANLAEITKKLIENAQEIEPSATGRSLSNTVLATNIIQRKAEQLYDVASSIIEQMLIFEAWKFIDNVLFTEFKSHELPPIFETLIEKLINSPSSSELDIINTTELLFKNDAKQLYPLIEQKMKEINEPYLIKDLIKVINEKLQKAPSPEVENLYNFALQRQQELG